MWVFYLCDEFLGGVNGWVLIYFVIEGCDLFVVCGMGVVFLLDVVIGLICFVWCYICDGVFN